MRKIWFKPRGYKHFDVPVGNTFAERVCDHLFVESHSWSPLIRYLKRVKRYKPLSHSTVYKTRPIMYASHRDACILSKYSYDLNLLLEALYIEERLETAVIAYRALGKSNHQFAAAAANFARDQAPCVALCFDITGFFDNLQHSVLKARLKEVLQTADLPKDWFQVYRHVTAYRRIDREALAAHPVLKARMRDRKRQSIATIREIKELNVEIEKNTETRGIPQGTPISSTFSNLYMLHFDRELANACGRVDALYQRYSDDLLIICKEECEKSLTQTLLQSLKAHGLDAHPDKCDRANFDSTTSESFQYLGFDISSTGAIIRASSLARQWRKLKRSISKAKRHRAKLSENGNSPKFFTKKLRMRFSPTGTRNFSLYARTAAKSLTSKQICQQVRRLERTADIAIKGLNDSRH